MCEMKFWRKHPVHDIYVSTCGDIENIKKVKCTPIHKNDYTRYRITKNGKRSEYKVHRLVAETWLEAEQLVANSKCNNRAQVNHKNHDTSDNHLRNVEWVTPSENVLAWHKFKGTNKK